MYAALHQDEDGYRFWNFKEDKTSDHFCRRYEEQMQHMLDGKWAIRAFTGSADCKSVVVLTDLEEQARLLLSDVECKLEFDLDPSVPALFVIIPNDPKILKSSKGEFFAQCAWDAAAILAREYSLKCDGNGEPDLLLKTAIAWLICDVDGEASDFKALVAKLAAREAEGDDAIYLEDAYTRIEALNLLPHPHELVAWAASIVCARAPD